MWSAAGAEGGCQAQPLGTPAYKPPEQIGGLPFSQVGDVYSLGATLYATLTDRPPFLAATDIETLMLVRNEDQLPPRRLNSRINRDLETICLKCLNKEPTRRYASAGELADDLQRFLDQEPIQASPVGSFERAARWTRRNPQVAALLATVIAALLLIAIGSTVVAITIDTARQREVPTETDVQHPP
ncbi:MAG: hypothetical protein ABI619_05155 [Betaproteobacteria bacterium]